MRLLLIHVSRVLSPDLQYGAVKDIRMATDEKGQPKGFAFVEYEQEVSLGLTSTVVQRLT